MSKVYDIVLGYAATGIVLSHGGQWFKVNGRTPARSISDHFLKDKPMPPASLSRGPQRQFPATLTMPSGAGAFSMKIEGVAYRSWASIHAFLYQQTPADRQLEEILAKTNKMITDAFRAQAGTDVPPDDRLAALDDARAAKNDALSRLEEEAAERLRACADRDRAVSAMERAVAERDMAVSARDRAVEDGKGHHVAVFSAMIAELRRSNASRTGTVDERAAAYYEEMMVVYRCISGIQEAFPADIGVFPLTVRQVDRVHAWGAISPECRALAKAYVSHEVGEMYRRLRLCAAACGVKAGAPDASGAKALARRVMLVAHPDKSASMNANVRSDAINAATDVLHAVGLLREYSPRAVFMEI